MLPKKHRMPSVLFRRVARSKVRFRTASIELRILFLPEETANTSRFSVAVPRSVGRAVLRNRLKRCVFSLIEESFPSGRRIACVFFLRPSAASLGRSDLAKEVSFLLSKTESAKPSPGGAKI